MSGPHRALEWLARRRDGESATLIAWRDGVSAQTVRRATAPYGPFPRPSRLVGRTVADGTAMQERTDRWVRARRNGRRVTDIAREDAVAHQVVSRYTAHAGPYPAPEVVQDWVRARRGGTSTAAIADTYATTPAVVSRETRAWGPFWRTGPRLPAGVVGVRGVAAMAGVSHPTAASWVRTGRAPEPDFVVGAGRKLWLDSTICRWLDGCDLATCRRCGARCVSLRWHRARVHPQRAAGRRHRRTGTARSAPRPEGSRS